MKFEIGKRVFVMPLREEATVHKIYNSSSDLWDNPDVPEIGNIQLKYDDGEIATSNNWQLCDLDDARVELLKREN